MLFLARGECTPHRTDDAFLLRFLRGRKFNVEAAYRLVSYFNIPKFGHTLKIISKVHEDE